MEKNILCTCKYILSILWALIIILYSAVNILQHLKAIWGLGSVPKPTGKTKPQQNTETSGKGSLYYKTAKTTAAERSFNFLVFARLCQAIVCFPKEWLVSTLEN